MAFGPCCSSLLAGRLEAHQRLCSCAAAIDTLEQTLSASECARRAPVACSAGLPTSWRRLARRVRKCRPQSQLATFWSSRATCPIGWQAGRPVGWLAGWLTSQLADWPALRHSTGGQSDWRLYLSLSLSSLLAGSLDRSLASLLARSLARSLACLPADQRPANEG